MVLHVAPVNQKEVPKWQLEWTAESKFLAQLKMQDKADCDVLPLGPSPCEDELLP